MSKASLIMVLGFGTVISYVGLQLASNASDANDKTAQYAEKTISRNLAISGANVGLAKYYLDSLWRGPITQNVAANGSIGSYRVEVFEGGSGMMLRSISSVGASPYLVRDTVDVRFEELEENSFSLYAWMTNDEGSVYWISGDTVWGAIHSNSSINVTGSPVFMGKVTTAGTVNGTKSQARFKQGLKTGASPVKFPNDLSNLANKAASKGKFYNEPIYVTLQGGSLSDGDGRAIVRSTSSSNINDTINLSAANFNGIIGSSGRVTVKGVLDGKLTLFSNNDIYVDGHTTYENVLNILSNNDILGLVAERDVVVADNVQNKLSAVIHGSIFCRSGSFRAENYQTRTPGILHVMGSIVQNRRGPVGTFSSGSLLKSGFLKAYVYDKRLANNQVRPPGYPGFYSTRRQIAGWWVNG